jgi:hypothetical protein
MERVWGATRSDATSLTGQTGTAGTRAGLAKSESDISEEICSIMQEEERGGSVI